MVRNDDDVSVVGAAVFLQPIQYPAKLGVGFSKRLQRQRRTDTGGVLGFIRLR